MKSNQSRLALILGLRAGADVSLQAIAGLLKKMPAPAKGLIETRIGLAEPHMFSEFAERLKPRQNVAAVEFTARGDNAIDVLMSLVPQAGRALAEITDPAHSNIVVGPLHVVDERDGDLMVMICCRRKAQFTADAYHDWWLNHHVGVGQKLCGGTLPFSAEMIHVDRSLSEQACKSVNYRWEPVDSYEMLVSDSQALDTFFSDERIQQGLNEDETTGGTDTPSLSIALMKNLLT